MFNLKKNQILSKHSFDKRHPFCMIKQHKKNVADWTTFSIERHLLLNLVRIQKVQLI